MTETAAAPNLTPDTAPDPLEPLPLLRRELHTGPLGLSSREAARRLAVYGPNEVRRTPRTSVLRELLRQLVHPLALLLWAAAALAFIAAIEVLGWAIVAVILVNAGFALVQERQAERAVETLASYLPARAQVIRDGQPQHVPARDLVPGDLIALDEGDRVPADARLTEGGIEADLSMLTGESTPVERVAGPGLEGLSPLQEPNLVFSGTTATEGQAQAIVFATGDHTELGRIAALSQRTRREPSPLETQVKKVAWLIAAVAVAMGAVFLVLGVAVGLPLTDSLMFAIGLLVANVPEGLLPTITLALAVGVRVLDRQGAVIKRLSAVETLGSTNVICTDKTGTLTRNQMRLQLPPGTTAPPQRQDVERDLHMLGLVGLYDPPRPEVAEAVGRCHAAGLTLHIVTGDNGATATAAAVARAVGIGTTNLHVVAQSEAIDDHELDHLLRLDGTEIVFARSSPETKLKVADALRAHGQIVAMTGDGVNDAPALHRAHIGVAMGLSGTDVAREASTMVLTDDNFATIVTAIESGRRVYDNVRKFIVYIFAHLTPEVVPFLVFALSGGAVPLPLTVLQILAIDLGTETLPALALGRERAEPGVMSRPPRPSSQSVINKNMLVRSWGWLGTISAALVMTAFFYVLWRAGWHPGDPTGPGTPLHHAYLTATTATFAGIVTCQVGTAIAARTDHAALRDIGFFSNPLLLAGIAFELVFTAALVYAPPLQNLFGTAALPLDVVLLIAAFPPLVWGTDEVRRWARRRHHHS
ncbi:cation-transporting P-type ATPase [Streptomyces sp. NBC_00091]|uniref:cation-translocating P-type ATPase n=1 Tax=Streptomyces sp. NBC_00091 TaxID=2975648 RepID=UPI0022564AED|nr:cation-transporting P-type ATPase [Streptomyces sp. NBC_00091]MCX5381435.1 cation-transporting P-type ATPase [Streptomyces sp. NBC_00091]